MLVGLVKLIYDSCYGFTQPLSLTHIFFCSLSTNTQAQPMRKSGEFSKTKDCPMISLTH